MGRFPIKAHFQIHTETYKFRYIPGSVKETAREHKNKLFLESVCPIAAENISIPVYTPTSFDIPLRLHFYTHLLGRKLRKTHFWLNLIKIVHPSSNLQNKYKETKSCETHQIFFDRQWASISGTFHNHNLPNVNKSCYKTSIFITLIFYFTFSYLLFFKTMCLFSPFLFTVISVKVKYSAFVICNNLHPKYMGSDVT